ncbi:MAG TPA: HAD family hydrolase [Ilumatobacteraceae bacterium]|nr:HAD family hydrolase [Ilumatobacteraceae bacterium]HRB03600.1 HAD family hydrolase [Ilumatobacteraceae bacterium]
MEHMVIALDVDGTLFDGVAVAPVAIDAIRRAHADGHHIVIVTGRRWESLHTVVPDIVDVCDRVVCEEGGVLVNVRTGTLTLLADPLEPALIDALRAAGVPDLDVGHVVVGAPTEWHATVQSARDSVGSHRHLVVNKGSVALAPEGCDKGTGLRAAIADLGAQSLRIIAIGDAANDLPMFAIASIAVGVANADETVLAAGIALTTGAVGLGVAEALHAHVPRSS